jgi:hypothetical protein
MTLSHRAFFIFCVLVLGATLAKPVHAKEAPTVFDHAYQGLLVGGFAGLATGYFWARPENDKDKTAWKPLVYGAGIGAIAGSTIGLTLSIIDLSQNKKGRHGYVMRDGLYGAGFGAVLGGLTGGLVALSTGKGEHVLYGASIGVLSGTVLGMTLGAVEGYKETRMAIVPVTETSGKVAFIPAVLGRF